MFDKYKTYSEYLCGEKVGTEVTVFFKVPMPGKEGGVGFPGQSGKLLWAFEDGILVRTEGAESFFRYADVQYVASQSSIKTISSLVA